VSLKQDQEKIAAERLAVENQRVYTSWIRLHPELSCIANERLIFGYLDDVVAVGITEPDLEFAVSQLSNRLAVKSAKSVAKDQADELAERNEAIQKENQRKLAMSTDELKADIRASKPNLTPQLPESWRVNGETVALTAENIKALPAPVLAKLMRLFGTDALNDRLGVQKQTYVAQSAKGYL
jgi:hypothetical protein